MLVFLQIVQVVCSAVLILLVLFHSAKGEGLGSLGGSAQMFRSTSHLERGLNAITWIVSVLFLVSSALLGWGLVK